MESWIRIIAFTVVTAFAAGCNQTQSRIETVPEKHDDLPPDPEPVGQLGQQVKDTAPATRDYAYSERTQYFEMMEGNLAQIRQDLEGLLKRAQRAGSDVKAEAKPKVEALQNDADRVDAELNQVKNATALTWDDIKASIDKSELNLEESLGLTYLWLNERIDTKNRANESSNGRA
jgi:hypothetical protein